MRSAMLPKGVLYYLSIKTKLPKNQLSDYLYDRRVMSKKRAIYLEQKTSNLGDEFNKENWMFNPEKIKQALINRFESTASSLEKEALIARFEATESSLEKEAS